MQDLCFLLESQPYFCRQTNFKKVLDKLEAIHARFQELELLISSAEVLADVKRFTQLNKEYRGLEDLEKTYHEYKALLGNIVDAKEMLKEEKDKETRDFVK